MVEWFEKAPGSDVGRSEDDPAMLLVGIGTPDWVRVPPETGHGGQYRCLEVRAGACPLPGHDHTCRHYVLNGPVWCAECADAGQFVWYPRPQ
jgi:hypothetical protein